MTVLRVLRIAAALATPLLVAAVAEAGGWTRFSVAAVLLAAALVVLRHELLEDRRRHGPGPRP